jgi:hypothetical protein
MNLYFLNLLYSCKVERRESIEDNLYLPNGHQERMYFYLEEGTQIWFKNNKKKISWQIKRSPLKDHYLSIGNLNLYLGFPREGMNYFSLRDSQDIFRTYSDKKKDQFILYLISCLMNNIEKMKKKGNLIIRTTLFLFLNEPLLYPSHL